MIAAYGKVAPYPFASVIGQEIFQSGVIAGKGDLFYLQFSEEIRVVGLFILIAYEQLTMFNKLSYLKIWQQYCEIISMLFTSYGGKRKSE